MENIKLFISYSWSNYEHEQLVLEIASELRESDVDVILDKWDLKEGHDAISFMEKMVTDPEIKKVAIISDKVYAEKADGRNGGVGTETQIISKEVYEQQEQNKFVVIVTERDDEGKVYLPTYYKSRIYIDLSEADTYTDNFEKLLRWVYNEPLYKKPELGNKPSFLDKDEAISLGTSASFKRLIDAIKNDKRTWEGSMDEYLNLFSQNLERFRVHDIKGELDDDIIKSIESFIPARNEYIHLLVTLAQYKPSQEVIKKIHRFIESLIPYMSRPEHIRSYFDNEFDNFKFIIHELFLYTNAIFLKYERFEFVQYLLFNQYYISGNSDYGKDVMVSYENLREYLYSFEERNRRLELRRLSLHADLLKERCQGIGIDFKFLMQADFVLYMKAQIHKDKDSWGGWWPETLLYLGHYPGTFEVFARAKSNEYFEELKIVLGIDKKEDIELILEEFKSGARKLPKWEFNSFSPRQLMGYDSLSTI